MAYPLLDDEAKNPYQGLATAPVATASAFARRGLFFGRREWSFVVEKKPTARNTLAVATRCRTPRRHMRVSTRVLGVSGRLLLLLAIGLCPPCIAQQVTASLSGSIKDTSGAVVPQAALTATDESTGVPFRTVSDSSGNYIFPSLAPANYTITAEKQGFRTTVISGVTLTVYQKATVNIVLRVGSVTQQVSVKGAAPLVSTTNASIGTVINQQQIVDLPLNLRRTSGLALLVPGVSNTTGISLASANGNGSGFNTTSFSAAGATSDSNLVLVDGMLDRALNNGGFALDLAPEMVKEFNIQNNVYDASYGITAGAVMNMVTPSGTNQFHGSAWEYLRNGQALDARNFFALNQTNPATGQEIPNSAVPEYIRNQFGFAAGGPIRKDKTFFFLSYEGLRLIQGETGIAFVPTTAEKNGDFASLLTGQTMNLCGAGGPANMNFDAGQLFNPAAEYMFTCPAGSANAGSQVLAGQPIAGNVITNMNPFAQKILALFPPQYSASVPYFINQTPYREQDDTGVVRIDESLSSDDQLFGHYMIGNSNEFYPGSFNPFNDSQYFRGQNGVLGWTHTFGPTLLNEARIGIARNYLNFECAECPHPPGTLASFGIEGVKATSPQTELDPLVTFVNFAPVGDGAYFPDVLPDTQEMAEDTLTKIKGRNTIEAGGNFYFYQLLGYEDPKQLNSSETFNGQYSSLASEIPGVSTVSDLADLEEGFPASGLDTEGAFLNDYVGGGWFSLFGQNNIRVSPDLSLQLGLRWEYRKQPYDKHDKIATLFPFSDSYTPGDALLLTALPDAANDALCSESYFISASGECLVMTSEERDKLGLTGGKRQEASFGGPWDNFAPRVGISWRPTHSDRLVIHSGAGIFYDLPETNQLVAFDNNNPVFTRTLLYQPPFGAPPPLTNGGPTTTETMFVGSAASASLPTSTGQLNALPFYFTPTVYEWSFGIDSQLAQNWALELNYTGNRGVYLPTLYLPGNQAKPGLGDLGPRRVYPDLGPLTYIAYNDESRYNALTARVTKRLSGGLSALVSYTYQAAFDQEGGDTDFIALPQNYNDLAANYSLADFDVPQRLVISPIWDLPIGNGRHFVNRTGLVNGLAGGWELSAILSFQSGYPFTVVSPQDFSNTGSPSPRPDRTCNGAGPQTVAEYFDTGCFSVAALSAAFTSGNPRFGNSGRNVLFGPGLNDWDVSLMKKAQISERYALEFRAQFFNLFNRPNFSNPGSTVGASNYGVITGAGSPRDIQFGLKFEF
jgi:Carboxypeptidase regulatory-like domain